MTTIQINIDDYLSESEKKQYAIEAFKESIKHDLFNGKDGVQLDSEIQRVIGNISHSIVMTEIQKYIPNYEELIKEKTLAVLQKDNFSYEVFKKKDPWGGEDSLAVTYMREVIQKNKELFQQKIKSDIENYDASDDIREAIGSEFAEMSDTLYKLSELFGKKS